MKTDPLPEPLPEQLPEPATGTATGLPTPRRGARWRWSGRRKSLVAGGAMVTVLGLGASAAGAATATSGPPAGAHGQPPAGAARPTVSGKVTAVNGNDVTVQTREDTTTTVVVSSTTTHRTATRPGGASSTASASALKVGDFIGVQGTRESDGTVTASSIVISNGAPPGSPGGHVKGGRPPAGAPAA
jgi:hypothetical protein